MLTSSEHRAQLYESMGSVAADVVDFGLLDAGRAFLAYRFQGRSLRAFADEGPGRHELYDALRLFVRSVQALGDRAESEGVRIVHCDLKPDNVLVVGEGGARQVVLCDWETWRRLDDSHSGFVGTHEFMPWDASLYNVHTRPSRDTWAVGATVLCTLVGRARPVHHGRSGQARHLRPAGRRLVQLAGRRPLDEAERAELEELSEAIHSDPERLMDLSALDALDPAETAELQARLPQAEARRLVPALRVAMHPDPRQRRLEPLREALAELAGHPEVGALPCRLGDFELIGLLGRGGHGAVFRARSDQHAEGVAVKVLFGTWPRSESELLLSLDHPNVVKVHAITRIDERELVVMELLEGTTLRGAGPLSSERLGGVLRDTAAALAYVHGQGLIHRDVKPANLHLGLDGVLRLLDLGLAKSLDDGDASVSQVTGTLHYAAPEQFPGRTTTPAADVYAFGRTAFELALGERLAWGAEVVDADRARLDGAFPGLGGLVARCVRSEPERRFPDGAALLAAIEALEGPRTRRVEPTPLADAGTRRVEALQLDDPGPAPIDWVRPRLARSVDVAQAVFFVLVAALVLWSVA